MLTRPDQLRALADDRRRRILALLNDRPRSIAGIAAELALPRGTAGYHVKLLERAGLIRVVGTQQRRGFVEKFYAKTAKLYVVQPEGVAATDISAIAAAGLREAAGEVQLDDDRATSTYGLVHARLRPDEVARFVTRLRALLNEFGATEREEGDEFGLVGAIWRRPG